MVPSPHRRVNRHRVALGAVVLLVAALPIWYGASGREHLQLDESSREKLGGTYVNLGDGVTHYEVSGSGEAGTAVLIHGATIPSWGWDFQAPALTKAGVRVLRYDQYGRGWSDRPKGAYDREFFEKQLGELLDRVGVAREVTLVGHSLGGALAVDFAVAHPDRVRAVALVDPVVNSVRDTTPFTVARVPVVGAFLMRTVMLGTLVGRADEQFKRVCPDPTRYTERYERQMEYRGFEDAALALFRSDMVKDHRAEYRRLGALGKPVLLVWGSEDDDIPREHVDYVREVIPDLELRILDGVGHSPTMEAPQVLNEILVDFIVATR